MKQWHRWFQAQAPGARRTGTERKNTNAALAAIAVLFYVGPLAAQSLTEVTGFGSNPGNLQMFKFVPAALPTSAPLVVALHGCTQRAGDYDDETGWTALAQRWRFALVLPQQRDANNPRLCFNWYNGRSFGDFWGEWGTDQDRDGGEPLSITQMVERMQVDHGIDRRRVYVTGLSGGGAMTAVMLATYPELFAGGAILGGVPYKCATTARDALTACGIDLTHAGRGNMRDLSAAEWRERVRAASNHAGPWPRVSIWHGDADKTVNPQAARELMEQWTAVHGIDAVADTDDRVNGAAHRVYRDARGTALVETYTLTGFGHGVPIDPGAGESKCGRPGKHVLAAGICASYYIGKFWGLDR
jgi:poly(hydroxyalkanoate) depolymerase family esterase